MSLNALDRAGFVDSFLAQGDMAMMPEASDVNNRGWNPSTDGWNPWQSVTKVQFQP
jgi:hypothetical protein